MRWRRKQRPWLHALALACTTLQGIAAAEPAAPTSGQAPQIARDEWKDCEFNLQVIGCIDTHGPDGLRILWKDGLKMDYQTTQTKQEGADDILKDRLGGFWRREVMIQGNVTLTNLGNGNRIMIPLRLTCRPPLKGSVGYCSY
jgi:hypothetical protein